MGWTEAPSHHSEKQLLDRKLTEERSSLSERLAVDPDDSCSHPLLSERLTVVLAVALHEERRVEERYDEEHEDAARVRTEPERLDDALVADDDLADDLVQLVD